MSGEPADKKTKQEIVLAYWDIRGLAQSIRLLLKYTATDFEDIRYDDGRSDDWFGIKETLGFDFPNLPYLIDGDVKLTQSLAILAYLGRKNNLAGQNDAEKIQIDVLANVIMDFRNGFVRLCYNSKFDSMKDDYLKNVKATLKRFSDFLKDKPWLTGNKISYVDFQLYEMLDQHRLFEPTILDDYGNLKAYLDRFEALPAIKEYLSSDEFKAYPVNGSSASWGGNKNK